MTQKSVSVRPATKVSSNQFSDLKDIAAALRTALDVLEP